MSSPVPPSSPPWTTVRVRDPISPQRSTFNHQHERHSIGIGGSYAVSDSRMDYGGGAEGGGGGGGGYGGFGYSQQQQHGPPPPPIPNYGLWTGPSIIPSSSVGSGGGGGGGGGGSSRNSNSGASGTGDINGNTGKNNSYTQNGYDTSFNNTTNTTTSITNNNTNTGSQPPYYQNMTPISIHPQQQQQPTTYPTTTSTNTNGGQYPESSISPMNISQFSFSTPQPPGGGGHHPTLMSNKRKSMTETFVPSHAGPLGVGVVPRRQGSGSGSGSGAISSSPLNISHSMIGGGGGGLQSGITDSSLEAANALAGLGQSHSMRESLSMSSTMKSVNGNKGTPTTITTTSGGGQTKKKKKKKDGDDEEDGRRKTSRACDVCRTKKIRCDIIIQPSTEDLNTIATSSNPHPHGLCAHCKNASLECTFFMPIAETRFKRRKQDAPMTSKPSISSNLTASPIDVGEKREEQSKIVPSWDLDGDKGGPTYIEKPDNAPRVEGPTSISFLLHSTAAVPRNIVESYDLKHHMTWAVTSSTGSGIIRVSNPPASTSFAEQSSSGNSNHDENGDDHRLDNSPRGATKRSSSGKNPLTSKMISNLVNDYFEHISPLFPIVSKAEFVNSESPSPLLLYVMCGVAATQRGKPRDVFIAIRGIINGMIRNNDVLSDSSYENVQALLILSFVGDLNAQPVAKTVSASVNRLSCAIRMAQDLGMHREGGQTVETAAQLARIELKRRVWACCVILDRWYAMCLGIPQIIDIYDCDVLVPCPCDVVPGKTPTEWTLSPTREFGHISEHLKLTILIGRILKTIYSPTGLMHTTDEQLDDLQQDMNEWRANLPEELRFTGNGSSHAAGLLHCTWVAANFLFVRVFMRLSYSVPAHLKFSMTMEKWNELIAWSRETIVWLHHNETALDTLFMWAYTSTSCALIQYHTWIRRRDKSCLDSLRMLKETVERWELATQPDHTSIRRKSIEVMSLLYAAALKAHTDDPNSSDFPDSTVLNPTSGVSRQIPKGLAKLVFRKDPTRLGGGVFVADPSFGQIDTKGLPAGLVILETKAQTGDGQGQQSHPQRGGNEANAFSSSNSRSAQDQQGRKEYQVVPLAAVSCLPGGDDRDRQNQPLLGNMNVNPGINQIAENWAENGIEGMLNTSMFTPASGQTGQTNDNNFGFMGDGTTFGFDMLDGMPQNGFDWPEWQQYFSRLGVPNGDESQMGDLQNVSNGWQNFGTS